MPETLSAQVLTSDFIDEAQVRFARATTYDLARYIERAAVATLERRLAAAEREATKYREAFEASERLAQVRLRAAESRVEDIQRELAVCERTRREILDDVNPRIASARVEGAREFASEIVGELVSHGFANAAQYLMAYIGRKYPAPSGEARDVYACGCWAGPNAGCDDSCRPTTGEEPTRRSRRCPACGRHVAGHAEDCPERPAPPAAPEPPRVREALVEVLAHSVINGDAWVRRLAKRLGVSVEPSLADEKCENAIVDALFALASRPTASGEG